jgi:hypothetical protein
MSWQIPTLIEQDIVSGKAQYRTFQTGNGGQSILPVPSNSYVVIFGYDFSPAGGGFKRYSSLGASSSNVVNDSTVRVYETQQISFYTGTDFYPFIHHCDVKSVLAPRVTNASAPDNEEVTLYQLIEEVDNSPIARQVYITSTNDVTVTHGLVINAIQATANNIPVTNRTPQGLTYGGSAQSISTQTNYGPLLTPQQFMQPSTKDYEDFAFGLLPANADGQAFATPDASNGLIDSSLWASSVLGATIRNAAANAYYLCLHYALYTETVPESRG